MEETKANKWNELEARKSLAEQLTDINDELGRELNELESEAEVEI